MRKHPPPAYLSGTPPAQTDLFREVPETLESLRKQGKNPSPRNLVWYANHTIKADLQYGSHHGGQATLTALGKEVLAYAISQNFNQLRTAQALYMGSKDTLRGLTERDQKVNAIICDLKAQSAKDSETELKKGIITASHYKFLACSRFSGVLDKEEPTERFVMVDEEAMRLAQEGKLIMEKPLMPRENLPSLPPKTEIQYDDVPPASPPSAPKNSSKPLERRVKTSPDDARGTLNEI